MSCIPKLLVLKGDKEILTFPNKGGTVIEDGGHYNGFDYLITFRHLGFRCGYVALPPEHPANDFHNEEYNYPDFEVHGGITFFGESHISQEFFGEDACQDKWLGFDCGHARDANDYKTAELYFSNHDAVMDSIKTIKKINNKFGEIMGFNETIKSKEYVIDQCKKLIDQLAV